MSNGTNRDPCFISPEEITSILWGATLYAGGGGGSLKDGLDLLAKFAKQYPGKKLAIVNPVDMEKESYAAITAGMGAPKAIGNTDFIGVTGKAFKQLLDILDKVKLPKPKYSMSVELGGLNTFIGMLPALLNEDITFLNTEGCGRAVPGLDTILGHLNELYTAPLGMATENAVGEIILSNRHDAKAAEAKGRDFCIEHGGVAGISGWVNHRDDIIESLPKASVTNSRKVGDVLRRYDDPKRNPFEVLSQDHNILCRPFLPTKDGTLIIEKIEGMDNGVSSGSYGKLGKLLSISANEEGHGFDIGKITLQGDKFVVKCEVLFVNENLVLSSGSKVIITAPDIIVMLNEHGYPLTNADIREGMRVFLGMVKVDKLWWNWKDRVRTKEDMQKIWQPYFDKVKYSGKVVAYDDNIAAEV